MADAGMTPNRFWNIGKHIDPIAAVISEEQCDLFLDRMELENA
jgi:hypothetical protein